MIVAGEQEKRLSLEVEYLQRSFAKVQQELENTRRELEAARKFEHENIRLQATLEQTKHYSDQRIKELLEQMHLSQQRIEELAEKQSRLEREIGESYVKGVMDTLREKGDLPKKE